MPDLHRIVVNTGPLIALAAGLGELTILREMYSEVVVAAEVAAEISTLRSGLFVQPPFARATWIRRQPSATPNSPWLSALLDPGEAAVIQLALDEKIPLVCINEAAGRRAAKLSGLQLTGSIGILLRAKREHRIPSLQVCLQAMRTNGVWLSDSLVNLTIAEAGE